MVASCDGVHVSVEENNVIVNIEGGFARGMVAFNCNAAFYQSVVVHAFNQETVFTGVGEGATLVNEQGVASLPLPLDGNGLELHLQFFYSKERGGTDAAPKVKPPNCIETPTHGLALVTLVTEDSTDNDDNDTIVQIALER